ncbi:TPA: hypothetical protein ACH3X2_008136 [Trebouxia sp. C0005]
MKMEESLDQSPSMLFTGDSANLSERVTSVGTSARLSPSLSTVSQWSVSSSEDGQAGRRLPGRSQSQQTAELIGKAKKEPRKQLILDAYMDKKLVPNQTPEANAARLRQKLEKLSAQPGLAPQDSKQVLQRGQHYIQHVQPLCRQKHMRTGSSAARIAYEAERQYNSHDGLCVVLKYMQDALGCHQGPQARQGAMQSAWNDVLAAMAFPQPADWQAEINSFIARGVKKANIQPAGFQCKKTACKLNLSQSTTAKDIAKAYFYNKITTHWNVGANCGHVQDKLQALLPLLTNTDVLAEVEGAAQACQHDMEALRRHKKANEAHRRQMRRQCSP